MGNTKIKFDKLKSENEKMLFSLQSMQKKRDHLIQSISLRIIHNLAYKRYFSANKGILERILFSRNMNIIGTLLVLLALVFLFTFIKTPSLFVFNLIWVSPIDFLYSVCFGGILIIMVNFICSAIELGMEATKFKEQDLIIRKALFEKKQSVAELITAYNMRLSLSVHELSQANEFINTAFNDYEDRPCVAVECLEQIEVDRSVLLKLNEHLDTLYYLTSGFGELSSKDVQNFVQSPDSWAFDQVGGVHDLMNSLISEHEHKLYSTGKLSLIDSSKVLSELRVYLGRMGITNNHIDF